MLSSVQVGSDKALEQLVEELVAGRARSLESGVGEALRHPQDSNLGLTTLVANNELNY